MLHVRRALVAAAVLAAMPASTVLSQAVPATMPTELVRALMATGAPTGETTSYFVGLAPGGWPATLGFPEARILGGLKSGPQMITIYADTSGRSLTGYKRVLEANGFTKLTAPEGRGFVPEAIDANAYCRGSARMTPRPHGTGSERVLIVTYDGGDGTCAEIAQTPTIEMPALVAPPGTFTRPPVRASAADEMTSRTRLYTMLPPSVILGHYTKQLAAAGWTVGTPAFSNTVAAAAVDARDRMGRYWTGSIVISSTTGDARDVIITLRNDRF